MPYVELKLARARCKSNFPTISGWFAGTRGGRSGNHLPLRFECFCLLSRGHRLISQRDVTQRNPQDCVPKSTFLGMFSLRVANRDKRSEDLSVPVGRSGTPLLLRRDIFERNPAKRQSAGAGAVVEGQQRVVDVFVDMELKTLLRNCALANKRDENSQTEEKEDEYFQKMYQQWKGVKARDNDTTYKIIPKFYFKLPKEDEILPQKLREETRALFLQRRSRQLLDNNELKALYVLLDKYHSPPLSGDEQLINYEDFKKVGKLAGAKCSSYFTAVVFAKLQQGDPHGRISITALFNYVMRKVWLHQTRIGLSLYDMTGQGYLRESDLENYILELIPTLPQLEGLEKSFHSFYVCTAVRKFLFFLDPLRTGRVRIQDILTCSFLDDLLELRDEDLPKDLQEANWFSAPSALKVYGQYLNLDRDHNGMLNKEELAGYGTGTLTGVFLERIFQECLTYEGEMDYKTYLDFVLALENRHEPQSLHYLFRILDINNRGYLDTFCLNYFFRAIQEQMTMHGQEPVSFEDVKDEIFDMVKPADPCKITLQDLLSCGQGDTMVSILIEFHGFWAYENREAMAADTGDESSHV